MFQPQLTELLKFFEPYTFADCLFPRGTHVICHQRKDGFFNSLLQFYCLRFYIHLAK
jgi:hypothetical protein